MQFCIVIFIIVFQCSGRISYYTCPPEQSAHHVAAEIVHNWGKAFDMVSGDTHVCIVIVLCCYSLRLLVKMMTYWQVSLH